MKDSANAAGGWLASLTAAVVSLLLLACVAVLVWASNRGLDITDEGLYVLSAAHPEDVIAWPNVTHVYTSRLYRLVSGSIPALRILGVLLLLASSGILAAGFIGLTAHLSRGNAPERSETRALAAHCLLGGLVYYFLYLPVPHYNLLTAVSVNATAGLTLLMLARPRFAPLIAVAIGAALCGAFFCKATAAVALGALCVGLITLWPDMTPRRKATLLTLTAFGAGLALAQHFVGWQSPQSFFVTLHDGLSFIRLLGAGHGPAHVFRYPSELYRAGQFMKDDLWPAWALCLAVLLLRRRSPRGRAEAAWVLLAASLFLFARLGMYGAPHWEIYSRFYFGWVATALFLFLLGKGWTAFRTRDWLVGGALLAFPLAGAVGSSNPITCNALMNPAPWFALSYILVRAGSSGPGARGLALVSVIALSVFAAGLVMHAPLKFPYRLNGGAREQSEPTSIGHPPQALRLDSETKRFVETLQQGATRCDFRAGDDIVAFCGMAGLVYALGGRSPGIPWYFGNYSGSKDANALVLSKIPRERLAMAFVMTNEIAPTGMPGETALGHRFPDEYTLCARATWPLEGGVTSLWKPKQRP